MKPLLRDHGVFILLFLLFSIIVLYRAGSVGHTYEETADFKLLNCLTEKKDPFACSAKPSQTRLVYYVHAAAWLISNKPFAQYLVSYLAMATLLIVSYRFLLKEKNRTAALLFTLLFVTSAPLLCSARLLLTHSNSLLALFITLSFLQAYHYLKGAEKKRLAYSGAFFGLAVAVSLLGIFSTVHFAILYLLADRSKRTLLLFFIRFLPAALIAFLGSTIIYLDPATRLLAIKESLEGHTYPYWNYLGTGQDSAPWYFSFVLYPVKLGPVFTILYLVSAFPVKTGTALLHKWIQASVLFTVFFLWLKSGYFHYDAPHHHVHLFPFAYMGIAVVLSNMLARAQTVRWKKLSLGAACIAVFAWHTVYVAQSYPNLLFYGAQYGKRFIGQFYGPAVYHGQDVGVFQKKVFEIAAQEPDAWFLRQQFSGTDLRKTGMRNLVALKDMDSSKAYRYKYAVLCHMDTDHLRFEDSRAYKELLESSFEPIYTYYFPWHTPMYSIYRKKISPG